MDLNSKAVYAQWVGDDTIIVTDNVKNRLVLRIANISGEKIDVKINDNMKLYFPLGNKYYHFTTGEMAKDIICTPPCDWQCSFDEEIYTWCISPKKPLKIQEGESIVIVFTNIISKKNYLNGNMSCLNIYFNNNDIENSVIQLPVFMKVAPIKINKFICSHSMVGILDEITFHWETTGAEISSNYIDGKENYFNSNNVLNSNYNLDNDIEKGVFLLPDFAPQLDIKFKSKDSAKCTVMETTNYTLLVSNNGESVIENWPVYVFEPKILKYTFVRKDNNITLEFTLENTCHCYISCGVGRIDCIPDYSKGYCISNGYVTVPINMYVSSYKLYCLGPNGLVFQDLRVPTE